MSTLKTPATKTHLADVLNHLVQQTAITDGEARKDYGIARLGARIYDLRQMGVEIETIPQQSKNRHGHSVRFALYKLQSKEIPAAALPYLDQDSKVWINEAEN